MVSANEAVRVGVVDGHTQLSYFDLEGDAPAEHEHDAIKLISRGCDEAVLVEMLDPPLVSDLRDGGALDPIEELEVGDALGDRFAYPVVVLLVDELSIEVLNGLLGLH